MLQRNFHYRKPEEEIELEDVATSDLCELGYKQQEISEVLS